MDFSVEGEIHDNSNNQKLETSYKEEGNKAEFTSTTKERITSLEQLVEFSEIDLDVWDIERWVCNKWDMAYKIGKDGSGGHEIVDLWQVKVWLKKRVNYVLAQKSIDFLIEDAKNFAPKYQTIYYNEIKDKYLLEPDMPDLHFGKLTWNEESGDDYDIKIARDLAIQHLQSILDQTRYYTFDKILFPLGNDFFNVNSILNTTVHGTPQQEDTRYAKTFTEGRRLAQTLIDTLMLIAPVEVIVVPGNHDTERMFYLGDSLECWYHNNPHVVVNNKAKKRKYFRYGKNLIGLTHGYYEKLDKLPLIMSLEEKQNWAETDFREWQTGDKHHKKEIKTSIKENEENGVMVRILRSLSGNDAWHFDKGFVGGARKIEAFVRHYEKGLIAQIHSSI